MANIMVRGETGNRNLSTAPSLEPSPWDAFRSMRDLLSWDPFREMSALMPSVPSGFSPKFEVKETKDGYLFKADVPGIKESDLDVSIVGNRLSIGGKREAERQEQTDRFYAYERTYGDFLRTFTLPEDADCNAIQADLKDGVLSLQIKKTPEMQPKKISIKPSSTPTSSQQKS